MLLNALDRKASVRYFVGTGYHGAASPIGVLGWFEDHSGREYFVVSVDAFFSDDACCMLMIVLWLGVKCELVTWISDYTCYLRASIVLGQSTF